MYSNTTHPPPTSPKPCHLANTERSFTSHFFPFHQQPHWCETHKPAGCGSQQLGALSMYKNRGPTIRPKESMGLVTTDRFALGTNKSIFADKDRKSAMRKHSVKLRREARSGRRFK